MNISNFTKNSTAEAFIYQVSWDLWEHILLLGEILLTFGEFRTQREIFKELFDNEGTFILEKS